MGMNDFLKFPDNGECLGWDTEEFGQPDFGDQTTLAEGEGDFIVTKRRASLVMPSKKDNSAAARRRASRSLNNSFSEDFADATPITKGSQLDLGNKDFDDLFAANSLPGDKWDDATMATATTCSSSGSGSNGSSSRLDYFGNASNETSNRSLNSSSSGLTMAPRASTSGSRLQRRGRRITSSRQASASSLDAPVEEDNGVSTGEETVDTTDSSSKIKKERRKKKKKEDRRSSMPTSTTRTDYDDEDKQEVEQSSDKQKKKKSKDKSSRRASMPTNIPGDELVNKKMAYAKMLREQSNSNSNLSFDQSSGDDVEDVMDRIKTAFSEKKNKELQDSSSSLKVED